MLKSRWISLAILTALAASILPAQTIPRPASELAVNMNDGSQTLLSKQRGKVVIVAFILTYCGHCQKAINSLIQVQNDLGAQGLQVIATAIEDKSQAAIPNFLRQFHPTFPVGFNDRQATLEFLQRPASAQMMMPQIAIVDRKGIIRRQLTGDDAFFEGDQVKNLKAAVDDLLKEKTITKKNAAPRKKVS